MKANGGKDGSARRRFLRTLAGSAVALPVLTCAPTKVAAKPVEARKRPQGYRETEHVRAFYRSALRPR